MARSLPIEPSVDWWLNDVAECREDDIMQAYASFNLKVVELRQDNDKTTTLSPQTPSNIEAVLSLLHRAQDLEKYREWYSSLPAPWKPDALAWVDWNDLGLNMGTDLAQSIVYPGRVDTYK